MGFYISSEKDKLDVAQIHSAISASYWGGYRTMEMTQASIENSICFGVYSDAGEQLGFARMITDKLVFAYIMDVIIFEPHQGKGLGKKLMQHLLDLPEIQKVLTIALKTKDAHGLYESFGFKKVGNSEMWMAKDNAKYD